MTAHGHLSRLYHLSSDPDRPLRHLWTSDDLKPQAFIQFSGSCSNSVWVAMNTGLLFKVVLNSQSAVSNRTMGLV